MEALKGSKTEVLSIHHKTPIKHSSTHKLKRALYGGSNLFGEREREIHNKMYNKHWYKYILYTLHNIKIIVRSEKGKPSVWFDSNLTTDFRLWQLISQCQLDHLPDTDGYSGTDSQRKDYYDVTYFPQTPSI